MRLQSLKTNLQIRHRVLQSIRAFFTERDFIEVETPVRVATPALELHIDAEPSGDCYLRTSPELHMKRLVAAGYKRIFQMGACFRRGERGDLHHPEFTMLEWYRSGADYLDILTDTKALIAHVANEVRGTTDIAYQGNEISLVPLWNLTTVSNAFIQHAGWDPVKEFDEDRFDLDLVTKVEPALPHDVPVILSDYPSALAALARRKRANPAVSERWELYIGGLELANAYSELTDSVEQKARFDKWAAMREEAGRERYPLDHAFLSALESGLPECAGIALGVDRLVMLLADAASLDDVMAFREG
ncbi:MAG: EF-P lysine aminoacylase GenX [Verrucomicrobia bacterium]|nr:EF-P lysine aminoacylase GenX [Verrucomicrobiota bacterium]